MELLGSVIQMELNQNIYTGLGEGQYQAVFT